MKSHVVYLVIILLTQPLTLLNSQDFSKDVIKAYELRMDGQIEVAKNLLTTLLENDAAMAMAHFEMARVSEDEKKSYHIGKALAYDPDNLMYHFYLANMQMLEAYKAMKSNNTELITKHLDECTTTLKGILEKKPDCKESLLFLIDIYGSLPEDMGGNPTLAKTYLKSLKNVDPLYAAHGALILKLKDEDVDMVNYWNNYIATHGKSNAALLKLGKAHLMTNDIEKAETYFNAVMEKDPAQTVLYLDVARAHLYTAMRGGDEQEKALEQFKKNINLYLDSKGKKPKILEAWCYGWLGTVESRAGNKKLGEKYSAKAESLMPNYPRFTAIPVIDQPPHIVAYQYKSYFSPF